MKKYLLIILCLMGVVPAMASYENSCVLKGVIANEPKKGQDGQWTFEFRVDQSGKYGRTDSGCESKSNKKISISVRLENPTHILKKGQVLWLRDLYTDNKGVGPMQEYSVMSETEGNQALSQKK